MSLRLVTYYYYWICVCVTPNKCVLTKIYGTYYEDRYPLMQWKSLVMWNGFLPLMQIYRLKKARTKYTYTASLSGKVNGCHNWLIGITFVCVLLKGDGALIKTWNIPIFCVYTINKKYKKIARSVLVNQFNPLWIIC